MSRVVNILSWIAGAVVSAVAYWYVVVYAFDEYNHGYGRLTWFQLSFYLSLLSVGAGVIGYAIIAIFLRRARSVPAGVLAGVAFTAGELTLVFALASMFPDRDVTMQGIAGALVIGALSALVARPKAS